MPYVCETFHHTSLHIKSPSITKFAGVRADCGMSFDTLLMLTLFSSVSRLVLFCSTSYTEIPVAVVKSKIWVADSCQVASLCGINLMNLESAGVFRTKRHWSVPTTTTTTTTTALQSFVQDYPGEPVPEETLTHPPSLSSSSLYQLLPSTTICSILPVQITCLAIFLHNLSPCPLWSGALQDSTSYSIHFFTQLVSSFCNTCPYHCNLFCCSISIISSIPSLSHNSLLGTLSFLKCSKIMQIGSGVLKLWTVKRRGLNFLAILFMCVQLVCLGLPNRTKHITKNKT